MMEKEKLRPSRWCDGLKCMDLLSKKTILKILEYVSVGLFANFKVGAYSRGAFFKYWPFPQGSHNKTT